MSTPVKISCDGCEYYVRWARRNRAACGKNSWATAAVWWTDGTGKDGMDTLFEIGLELAQRGARASARTLHQQLEAAILDGRLAPGSQLPPTRRSAEVFRVSRNTAAEVYERLLTEGHVVTRAGSGTYVAARKATVRSRATTANTATASSPPDPRLNPFWLRGDITRAMGFWHDQGEAPAMAPSASAAIDFRPALVDSALFPHDVFRRIVAQQLRGLERKPASLKSPQGNQGNPYLREAISRHIALTRAVVGRPEDVIVASGAQQAFDLLARVLVKPGETVVALEDPGYPPLRVAFAAAGAKLVPMPVDDEGLAVAQLPPGVGVVCVTPSHQFPLGVAMSPARRRALLAYARKHGAVVIEDDYDGEFRFDGSPLEALRTGDAADTVFYVGTFSKCMLPALRLGYVVAPAWAMPTLIAAKNCLDWHCPTPLQTGVAGFIAGGHLSHHVRKMRQLYKQRRQLLAELLHEHLSPWLRPLPSSYGMHLAVEARGAADLESAAQALLRHNVKLHTLRRYFLGPATRQGLVLGYGAVSPGEIRRGLELLRQALGG
jgi:GntR family transcriptional regulator/MocR family aminotransferase